jgi:hypothetical protein
VIRNVSEDFCAMAGTAIESVPQAANNAPRSQLFERIYCPFNFNAEPRQTMPGTGLDQ